MKKAIVLANGDIPAKSQIIYLSKIGYSFLICADGGANSASKLNVVPDLIIGDLDSITDENKKIFADKCKIIQIKRQNDTDVEKSLKYLIRNNYEEVILLGATGDRLDHSICNLGIVLKFFNQIRISIVHKKSFLRPYKGEIKLKSVEGETISIYAFNRKTKITSKGLKYPLKKSTLPFGEKESTSNVALGKEVSLSVKGGIAFVVREFNLMKKYDLL